MTTKEDEVKAQDAGLVLPSLSADSQSESDASGLSARLPLSDSDAAEDANARALVVIAKVLGWRSDAPCIEPWQVVEDVKRLEARVSRLTEALQTYGAHDVECAVDKWQQVGVMHKPRPSCTCGLEAALSSD